VAGDIVNDALAVAPAVVALHHAPVDEATGAIRSAVLDAVRAGTPLRIVAAGGWLEAGFPVAAATPLSVASLTGITEYNPGDLTLTARAGTTLAELEAATAKHGQWLPIQPGGAPSGTIGATVATSSAGPLSHAFGTPRDAVLGIECVTGAGDVIRAGGRVTKNVAGFDLVRLLVGSWGTLGVITTITIRLRARPRIERTLAIPLEGDSVERVQRLHSLRSAAISAMAIELVNAPLARHLGIGDSTIALVRLGGNDEAVRAQVRTVSDIGDTVDAPASVWAGLRLCEPTHAWVWRDSDLPSLVHETWERVLSAADAGGGDALVHASIGRGIVRCIAVPADAAALGDSLARRGTDTASRGNAETPEGRSRATDGRVTTSDHTRIVERLPDEMWRRLGQPVSEDRISRRIRATFDPAGILNRGIMGDDAR
jgi:glycolate oxidase FAD binding subunit